MNTGPTLILTRPLAQSVKFLETCQARSGRSIPAVISPVLRIAPISDALDLPDVATIVVTSSNAVLCLGDRLQGRTVMTVGVATAELAISFGARATCLGETAEALLGRTDQLTSPVLVARGVHNRFDLAAALNTRGINAIERTVYDQLAEPLSSDALNLLSGSRPVVAPIFSPRSATLLGEYPVRAPLTVLAISAAVADAWPSATNIRVATRPDAEAMCDLVTAVL